MSRLSAPLLGLLAGAATPAVGAAEVADQWWRADLATLTSEQEAVLQAIRHAWRGYREHAWGEDDLKPISRRSMNWIGLGLTLVDSLDLLYMVGEDEEFERARDWVRDSLDPRADVSVNFFETTIRVLGGLLSAHYLTGGEGENAIFLERAGQLAEGLSGAFQSPSGVPWSDVRLAKGTGFAAADTSLSEASTVQLEFKALAHWQGHDRFRRMSEKAMDAVFAARDRLKSSVASAGLVPIYLDPHRGVARNSKVSLGARGDSYYEYLLKQWLLTKGSGLDARYLSEYQTAVDGIMEHLVYRIGNWTVVTELGGTGAGDRLEPIFKMDHLVCFLPGTLALGHLHGADPYPPDSPSSHLALARDLLETCVYGYDSMQSGMAPEIWHFRGAAERYEGHPRQTEPQECIASQHGECVKPKKLVGQAGTSEPESMYVKAADAFSLLRPETVESLFYLWRITGDVYYRQAGWRIFKSIEANAVVEGGGYSSMEEVNSAVPVPRDRMESFFLAETLKYLFLLFDDHGLFPLDKVVFNTEGHPLPIF